MFIIDSTKNPKKYFNINNMRKIMIIGFILTDSMKSTQKKSAVTQKKEMNWCLGNYKH